MVGINEVQSVQSYFMQLPPVVTLLYLCLGEQGPRHGTSSCQCWTQSSWVGDPWRRVHQGTSVHSDVDPDQSWPIYVHLRAHPCSVGHGKSMATQFSKIWVASFWSCEILEIEHIWTCCLTLATSSHADTGIHSIYLFGVVWNSLC